MHARNHEKNLENRDGIDRVALRQCGKLSFKKRSRRFCDDTGADRDRFTDIGAGDICSDRAGDIRNIAARDGDAYSGNRRF